VVTKLGRITSIEQLVTAAENKGVKIADIVLEDQVRELGVEPEVIWNDFSDKLEVMASSLKEGLKGSVKSASGLCGGEASRLLDGANKGQTVFGLPFDLLLARAMAVAEVNASMGRIVAAPTAGSCGVLPAVIFTIGEQVQANKEAYVQALLTAAGIGLVISHRASLSGAEGGCQAEVGSAAAMAAAAAVEMVGGTPRQAASAVAISLKNLLGLVGDPVAGLVEVPCIKRNAAGASIAAMALELALAGVESFIPADEVIDAMRDVGRALPCALRETSQGGLAVTPTARQLEKRLRQP